jgi:hypothetical protein
MTMSKPTDWDQLYPNRFLKAGELQGKKVTLTIKDIDLDNLVDSDGKEKVKGVVSFEGTPKQIALNKTNGLCLRAMFGKKLSEWMGKKVILFPGQWGGEEAIRIWGSPDIKEAIDVEVKLPRRKAQMFRMHTSAAEETK